jgi:hypothetical protein
MEAANIGVQNCAGDMIGLQCALELRHTGRWFGRFGDRGVNQQDVWPGHDLMFIRSRLPVEMDQLFRLSGIEIKLCYGLVYQCIQIRIRVLQVIRNPPNSSPVFFTVIFHRQIRPEKFSGRPLVYPRTSKCSV